MNTNSNPDAPRIISTRTWEKRPGAGRQEFALTAGPGSAPGVTPGYWPIPPRRTRMSWRGSWLAKYGAAARPRHIVARISRLYRLQRTRGRPWQSGPPESAHCPGHLSPGRPESHSRLSSPFPEFLPLASPRRRPTGSRAGAASRRDTGRRRGPGARARAAPRHDRHGPNPRPSAQIRSNLPRGATRSSTARYFVLYRIKVT